jgi:hypothetical protein
MNFPLGVDPHQGADGLPLVCSTEVIRQQRERYGGRPTPAELAMNGDQRVGAGAVEQTTPVDNRAPEHYDL